MTDIILEDYKTQGGVHHETAVIKNILDYYDVKNPFSNEPFSEAMLFGIGGGLGIGYILWEFKKYKTAVLVLAFQNKWNYPVKFINYLCTRLGIKTFIQETAGIKIAEKNLLEALKRDEPPIVWAADEYLSYIKKDPEIYTGDHRAVNIFGYTDNGALINDLAYKPFIVDKENFLKARARVPSIKNRMITLSHPKKIDIKKAINSGIVDCVDYLSSTSQSFSLPAIRKWSHMMTSTSKDKGWPIVFYDKIGLYNSLRCVFEEIKYNSTEGYGLRSLYADFLREAAEILDLEDLNEVAIDYVRIAKLWESLADFSFSKEYFGTSRDLLRRYYDKFRNCGQDGVSDCWKLQDQLEKIKRDLDINFPLEDKEIGELYYGMSYRLTQIFEEETKTIRKLADMGFTPISQSKSKPLII